MKNRINGWRPSHEYGARYEELLLRGAPVFLQNNCGAWWLVVGADCVIRVDDYPKNTGADELLRKPKKDPEFAWCLICSAMSRRAIRW